MTCHRGQLINTARNGQQTDGCFQTCLSTYYGNLYFTVVHCPETGKCHKIEIKCNSSTLAQYVGVITVKDKITGVFVLKMCFFFVYSYFLEKKLEPGFYRKEWGQERNQ